ncbi:hypothetical protein [Pseudomonas syringae group genomosp. 3]|uniref:hypothetical protein n=1 Tax=Pseudomonas syringae group genomosp. 3 TaxID=251701 RepID=UPI0016052D36|nr:hypothetical protein [Pseudomonas syringae group genomosp. 3]
MLDLIATKFVQMDSQVNGHSKAVLLSNVADRLVDPADKASFLKAVNERFVVS